MSLAPHKALVSTDIFLFIYVASFDIVLIQVALPLCSFSHAHYIE